MLVMMHDTGIHSQSQAKKKPSASALAFSKIYIASWFNIYPSSVKQSGSCVLPFILE
jgi:hypothetical protein